LARGEELATEFPASCVLPARLARLEELAYNLWWSWRREARDLFKMLDYPLWQQTSHNPVQMLMLVSAERLEDLAADPEFLRRYDAVIRSLDADLADGHLWFPTEYPHLQSRPIAYFSAEFGIHRSLPVYSGGLGVLAGDHCKEASDIGLPLVAIGFLYQMGYFRQRMSPDGRQEAVYQRFEPREAAVRRARATDAASSDGRGPESETLFVPVEVGGRTVYLQVWQVDVGRVSLYLMDADNDKNAPLDRELTARLYGGDQEMRIQQEVVLGIGGLRVLRALGIDPAVYHLNEGHSAFVTLELARELVESGLSFEEARRSVQECTLFTTHTPVPAGHDAFPFRLVSKYLLDYATQLGIGRQSLLQLGCCRGDEERFNMTVLALRMSGYRNGVSRLHGRVSRRMWSSVWADSREEEVPIAHVTNGVHVPSWVGEAMNRVYRKYLGPDWLSRHDDAMPWERVTEVPDSELWAAHLHLKGKLKALIRERARRRWVAGRIDAQQALCAGTLLDPDALIIGFARRFATYKRATLVLSDEERLRRLLHDPHRPVQFVFAGKAHPADEEGKRMLQRVYQAAKNPANGGRIAFIEDYDLQVARYLVQGVDVWLNTPRRLHEASGTSGQKAAINGVPNLGVLDGWWAEGYTGSNGWAIGPAPAQGGEPAAEAEDAESLYRLLEDEVAPLYYRRDADGVPRGWVGLMREAIRTAAPVFCTRRMLKEYAELFYVPAAERVGEVGQPAF
jgi:starch phosphorylase